MLQLNTPLQLNITQELFTNVRQNAAFLETDPVAIEPEPTGSQTRSGLLIQSSSPSPPTHTECV